MTVMDYLKSAAMNFVAPPKKQLKNLENPSNEATYKDLNQDGPDPLLKPKKTGVHFFNPAKDADKDISRNKHGHYVATLTYPLPPLSWEKKQFDLNKRMRNGKNKYL